MRVTYEEQDDLFDISKGSHIYDGADLRDYNGVILHFGTDGGRDIVAVTVMGASHWFRKGYDESADTWFLGDTDDKQSKVVVDGDFLGYWPLKDEYEEFPIPIGFALLNASKYLASVRHRIEKRAATTKQPQA